MKSESGLSVESSIGVAWNTAGNVLSGVFNGNGKAVDMIRGGLGTRLFALVFSLLLVWAIFASMSMYNMSKNPSFGQRVAGAVGYVKGMTK